MQIKKMILVSSLAIFSSCGKSTEAEKAVEVQAEISNLKTNSQKQEFLEYILQADQEIRNGQGALLLAKYGEQSEEYQKFFRKIDSIDNLNLERVDKYLQKFGYPDRDSLSGAAAMVPWLVIHHSDLQERKKYFPYLYKAYQEKNLEPDQLELYLGRTYHLQFGSYPHTEGAYDLEEKIDRLMEELGLKE